MSNKTKTNQELAIEIVNAKLQRLGGFFFEDLPDSSDLWHAVDNIESAIERHGYYSGGMKQEPDRFQDFKSEVLEELSLIDFDLIQDLILG